MQQLESPEQADFGQQVGFFHLEADLSWLSVQDLLPDQFAVAPLREFFLMVPQSAKVLPDILPVINVQIWIKLSVRNFILNAYANSLFLVHKLS